MSCLAAQHRLLGHVVGLPLGVLLVLFILLGWAALLAVELHVRFAPLKDALFVGFADLAEGFVHRALLNLEFVLLLRFQKGQEIRLAH